MTKEKKLLLIPLIIIAVLLIYCWIIILTTGILATWRHYIGLGLFILIVFLFFKNLITATIGTGIYLLLATFNLLAMTTEITTSGIRIGGISTPGIQLLSLGLFIIYFLLNLNPLIDINLDYQEKKKLNKKN
jgi:hypothetical protein